jgi:hypothetical protein
VVRVMVVVDKNLLCVACKTLMACITLYNIVPIMLSLCVDVFYAYLSCMSMK